MINSVNGGIADIRNIAQCYDAVMRTLQRNPNLAGLACFYGPSGFGKSFAANYVANKTGAYYVQVKSTYTKKSFLQALLREMSIPDGVPEIVRAMSTYQANPANGDPDDIVADINGALVLDYSNGYTNSSKLTHKSIIRTCVAATS